jgi:penicillin-insensitive murein endopeptidase
VQVRWRIVSLGSLALVGVCAGAWVGWGPASQPAANAAVVLPPAPAPEVLFVPTVRALPVAAPAAVDIAPLTDTDFSQALQQDLPGVGSISIGQSNRGSLYNGVRFPDGPLWQVMEPKYAYGTEETVQAIGHAITEVNRLFPNSPRLSIGHLSREHGGWLRPHRSHQSGRDVDLGFYYHGGQRWYVPANETNLDVARTWALISALLKTTEVDYLFVDKSLHALLRAEAERIGESAGLVREVFDGDARERPLLRHARGHATHLHVRFASPVATQNALRAGKQLRASGRRSGALLGALKQRARVQRISKDGKRG